MTTRGKQQWEREARAAVRQVLDALDDTQFPLIMAQRALRDGRTADAEPRIAEAIERFSRRRSLVWRVRDALRATSGSERRDGGQLTLAV